MQEFSSLFVCLQFFPIFLTTDSSGGQCSLGSSSSVSLEQKVCRVLSPLTEYLKGWFLYAQIVALVSVYIQKLNLFDSKDYLGLYILGQLNQENVI